MTELFQIEPVLSPRLLWMREHGVRTHFCENSDDPPWWAWSGPRSAEQVFHGSMAHESFAQADTEDEAIVAHAKLRNLRLWNEQSPASPSENRDQ